MNSLCGDLCTLQKFTLYYTNMSRRFEDVNLTSVQYDGVQRVDGIADQKYELTGLVPCQDYFFRVQITEPHRGALSSVSEGHTSYGEWRSCYSYFVLYIEQCVHVPRGINVINYLNQLSGQLQIT